MKINTALKLTGLLLVLVSFHSCIIEEHYHFDKDMSGTYSMSFDLGKFAEKDTTGEMMKGVLEGMEEELSQIQGLEGISSIETDYGESTVNLSYQFKDVKALNRIENLENEGKEENYFSLKKNVLTIALNLDEVKESAKGGKEEEVGEMLSSMIQYKVTVSFDEPVSVKKMSNFDKLDETTFVYDSEIHGFDSTPMLKAKLK
jgi:hypothetical protein